MLGLKDRKIPQTGEDIILDPAELSFYEGIIVCEFSEAARHLRDLQTNQIEAIFFKLPEDHRSTFQAAAAEMRESVADKTRKGDQEVELRAEKYAGSQTVHGIRYEFTAMPRNLIAHEVEHPPAVAQAFGLMSRYLGAVNIDAHEHFAKQSPPNHFMLFCAEYHPHRDVFNRHHPQNDIHAHVTVDGTPLAFRKHNTIFSKKHFVPDGYGVLFNNTWLHFVDRKVKITGRTAFGAFNDNSDLNYTFNGVPLVKEPNAGL